MSLYITEFSSKEEIENKENINEESLKNGS